MKFNITAKKLNEVDINFDIELTPDEFITSIKQGGELLNTLLYNKDKIVEAVTTIMNCYTDNVVKTQKHIEEVM